MQQLNFRVWCALNRLLQWGKGDRAYVDDRMMHSRILHAEDNLKNQTPFRRHSHEALHSGMVKVKWLVTRINPEAWHSVHLVTTANIFLPVRPREIDAAKRNQKIRPMLPAFGSQPRVDPIDVF